MKSLNGKIGLYLYFKNAYIVTKYFQIKDVEFALSVTRKQFKRHMIHVQKNKFILALQMSILKMW